MIEYKDNICNHLIGHDHEYDTTHYYISDISKLSKDDVNHRKHQFTTYNHCPMCGFRINWAMIKQMVI